MDLSTILIMAAVALAAYSERGRLKGLWQRLTAGDGGESSEPGPSVHAAVDAATTLEHFHDAQSCQEGVDAARLAGRCIFHDHEHAEDHQ